MKTHLEKGNSFTSVFIDRINSGKYTKIDAADMLGISRPTLDKRIESDMWKKSEIRCIELICIR